MPSAGQKGSLNGAEAQGGAHAADALSTHTISLSVFDRMLNFDHMKTHNSKPTVKTLPRWIDYGEVIAWASTNN